MLRHGQTVANQQNVAAGSSNSPLTEKGIAQARSAEEIIYNIRDKIDYIVHSQLSRAKDTAKIVNQRCLYQMYENKLLAEQCFGDWMGMAWKDMRSLMAKGHNPPNGESLNTFYDRAMKGILEALDLQKGTPLIVTHGGVFDALLDRYGLENIDVENCAIYEILISESDINSECEIDLVALSD